MCKLSGLLATIVLLCLPMFAQERKLEVFGGYSLFRVDADDVRRFIPDFFDFAHEPRANMQELDGWDAEVSGRLTHLISVVGDVSGHYQTVRLVAFAGPLSIPVDVRARMYNFLAGPRVSFKAGPVQPFAHVLAGLSRTRSRGTLTGASLPEVSDNNFAVAIGGGIDVPIRRFLSIRPVKLDYMRIKTDPNELHAVTVVPAPSWTNNLRYSAGVAFRF